jgi:3-phosphoshikimate 1-carboxyvinyltransferase
VPGDKSIAHRALILGALADGAPGNDAAGDRLPGGRTHTVTGLPESADVASTAECLRRLGCSIERDAAGLVHVTPGAMQGCALDAGNSGTTTRLLAGLIAGKGLDCTIDGDGSLRLRPMRRIAEPLGLMGAKVVTAESGGLPMRIRGGKLKGITYPLPVASAQVKSCILIAGLFASGTTTVIEPAPTRDHTELMLAAMGVPVIRDGNAVTVKGGARLQGVDVTVPGDVSSAAFFATAAAIVPGSGIRIAETGINPTRTGALEVLRRMGAPVVLENERTVAGEPIADIAVNAGPLQAADIGGNLIPTLIDELPILAVAATQAHGTTTVSGAEELRHKESDRIAAVVTNLSRLGALIEERGDGFVVHGPCGLHGARVDACGDHRIAMAMAVAGLVASGQTIVENADVVAVSYPRFFEDLASLAGRGAK